MRTAIDVRVYLEDTDAQGVVYNASYFRFMERARTECVRVAGLDHTRLRAEHGVSLVLASIEARFKAPARLDDLLRVTAEVTHVQGARVVFRQQIRRGRDAGEVVCDGVAAVACVGAADGKPRRLPKALLHTLEAPSAE